MVRIIYITPTNKTIKHKHELLYIILILENSLH